MKNKAKLNETIQYLKKIVRKIKKHLHLDCVILFGSRARGDFLPHSDIDLIIVGDFKQPFIKRADLIYRFHDFKVGLDAFCYTREEFNKMVFEGVVNILDAIDEGICIYGFDFFNNYKDKIEQLKKRGLKKVPFAWILPESMKID